jgi:hypothetical protein
MVSPTTIPGSDYRTATQAPKSSQFNVSPALKFSKFLLLRGVCSMPILPIPKEKKIYDSLAIIKVSSI